MQERIIKKLKNGGLNREEALKMLLMSIIESVGMDKVLDYFNYDLDEEFEDYEIIYLLDYLIR